jgi:serine/threonine protein kinase
VAGKTSIRVPKVYCAFEYDSVKFILMERIDGIPIQEGWLDRPEAEREDMLQQLKGYYEELRSIPHPHPGAIAAADMQSLFDPRLIKGEYGFGPFAEEKDFNNYLQAGIHADAQILSYSEPGFWMTKDEQNEILRMIAMQDKGGHKVCFSHGDPNPGNFLVKGNKIVALIDFELAGFYPEYWDYCKAMSVRSWWQFWETEVGKFLQEYPRELEMEKIRKKTFLPRWVSWGTRMGVVEQ